jgi:hypothetical protein
VGLTGAWAKVWQLSDDDEAVAEVELSGSGAQAWREGEKGAGRTGGGGFFYRGCWVVWGGGGQRVKRGDAEP